jgi:Ca2+-binding EF-hand superfamily protein
MFDMFAKQMNVTNGQITRAQFTQGAEQMRSMMGGGGMGGFGGGRGPGSGGPGGGMGAGMTPQQQDEFAVDRFRRADKNGDGFLDQSEMSDRLKPTFHQYDTNKDGMLDLNEYKGYMKSFFTQQSTAESAAAAVNFSTDGKMGISLTPGGSAAPEAATQQEEDARATVFRTGKLPKDIPNWFEQIDTDKDGQIGLYEWVKAGRAVDDFRAMDRNDDNFVTIDELMAYVRNGSKSVSSGTAVATASPGGNGPQVFGMPAGGNDRGGFRFGRGGEQGGGSPPPSDRGGFRGFNKGGENAGGPPRWGKGGENGGSFRGFNKGGDRGEKGSDRSKDNSGNATSTVPGASTPPAATPGAAPADSRRPDGRGNRREDKGGRRP